jgi:HK97 family phage major capsid protein
MDPFNVQLTKIETDLAKFILEQKARMLAVEQRMTTPNFGGDGDGGGLSIGDTVAQSSEFKSFAAGNSPRTGRIAVPSFSKTTIVSAGGLGQPLVAPYIRPGVIVPGQQRLTIRDLMPNIPVTSNLVEYTRETSFTSAAAMQTAEGNSKAESAAAFELKYSPVQTLAHWIPASRQILDDSAALTAYLNARLVYFLKLKEEDELLNGTGIGTDLSGLIANSTTFDTTMTTVATDTMIDVLAHAMAQVLQGSNFESTAIIVNNLDWANIQLIKTTGTASSGQYIFSDPRAATIPMLWNVPVIPTKSMPRSQFLVGNFQMAAAIWDRNQATIEISREHSDFFTRNLVAILAEERLALTVFQPLALVFGGFPYGS